MDFFGGLTALIFVSIVAGWKLTQIRAELGSLELDQTFTARNQINEILLRDLDEATDPWGVKVTRVELRDILPAKAVQESMELQMTAERKKRSAILTSETLPRIATIKRALSAKLKCTSVTLPPLTMASEAASTVGKPFVSITPTATGIGDLLTICLNVYQVNSTSQWLKNLALPQKINLTDFDSRYS